MMGKIDINIEDNPDLQDLFAEAQVGDTVDFKGMLCRVTENSDTWLKMIILEIISDEVSIEPGEGGEEEEGTEFGEEDEEENSKPPLGSVLVITAGKAKKGD